MASRTRRAGSVAPAVRPDSDKITGSAENGSMRPGSSGNNPPPTLGGSTGGSSGPGATGSAQGPSNTLSGSSGATGSPASSLSPQSAGGASSESKLPSVGDVELLKELNQVTSFPYFFPRCVPGPAVLVDSRTTIAVAFIPSFLYSSENNFCVASRGDRVAAGVVQGGADSQGRRGCRQGQEDHGRRDRQGAARRGAPDGGTARGKEQTTRC